MNRKPKVVVLGGGSGISVVLRGLKYLPIDLKPVKEELRDVIYVYVADESSPEGKWKITIPDIHGIHYRITNEQSAALGKLYEYPGIPTYFVIDREGKLSYKVTGFPGAEKMREELIKL